ncbi:MAG: hypothetical protein PVJ35_01990 [Desulfobacterales bacterium]|jgi:hypothetical protein
MFYRLYSQIEQQLEKIYFDSRLNRLVQVLPTTHNKIITAFVQQCLKFDLLSYGGLQHTSETTVKERRFDILAFVLNSEIFTYSIFKYCFVQLLYRLIVKQNPRYIIDKNDMKFVFVNSAGGVDRLASIIHGSFHKDICLMLYLFTSFPKKIFERTKKNPEIGFIPPGLPNKKAIQKCLIFLFKDGHNFTSKLLCLFNHYPLSLKLQIVTAITKYYYALLIYHSWAEENALKLAAAYPNALFIFDLDEAGKELLLADSLNRLGKKTLVIQHGILTDAKRYIPTCSYMACNSERDRQALISEGVGAKKLYVTGQPLQTIEDSIPSDKKSMISYPILILAGAGPIWLQRNYVKMLKRSQYLKSYPHTFMRIHPAMDAKQQRIWLFNKNLKPTDPKESLRECISKCQFIITFSIDALVVAVRQQRPTIVCIPESFFFPAWHNFLKTVPMVKLVKNPCMLDEALEDKNFLNDQQNDLSDSQWRYVDYAFGDLNTKVNLTKLMNQLVAEYEI